MSSSKSAFALFIYIFVLCVSLGWSKLVPSSPKYTISANDGAVLESGNVDPLAARDTLLRITKSDILKLSFKIVDDLEGGGGVKPHQAFLRFEVEGGEEGVQPLKVAIDGSVKFSLNPKRPPPGIPATPVGAELLVHLILGSYTHESTLTPLFKLRVPASETLPLHPEEKFFRPRNTIYHTFRSDPRMPPSFISSAFTVIALIPWPILIYLLAMNKPDSLTPSTQTALFITLLILFEYLIVRYWVDLSIGQLLTYASGLALMTGIAGQRALLSI